MAKEYNKSDYVYCAKKSDGTWILYNFFEKKFLILSDFQKMIYDCAPYDDINSPFLKKLVQGGFLTCEDEYEKLLNRQIQKQKKDKLVKLTICPTMACNFSCSYCIETGQLRKGKMSEEIQNKTVQFVKKLLKKAKADSLQIIWFGGEPMLEIEIIQSLSEKLILLADSLKIPYTSGIYTNGYFLTEKNIRILEKCRVRTVRISVDGSQESHDRMRYLAGGQGTYRRILENLSIPTTLTYRIRCNMTKDNLNDFEALENELREIQKKSGNTIFLTAERMRVEKEVNEKLHAIELPYPEYYAFYQKVKNHHISKDDNRFYDFLFGKGVVCSASRPYSFCVDELGNIYKCNWFYGKDEHVIGNVATFKKYKELISQPEAKSFLSKRVTPREKCKNCVMLPVCLGRCPLSWEVEEKYDCNRAINDLDKLIPEAYEWYQHFNES